jgi:hypothetical protein
VLRRFTKHLNLQGLFTSTPEVPKVTRMQPKARIHRRDSEYCRVFYCDTLTYRGIGIKFQLTLDKSNGMATPCILTNKGGEWVEAIKEQMDSNVEVCWAIFVDTVRHYGELDDYQMRSLWRTANIFKVEYTQERRINPNTGVAEILFGGVCWLPESEVNVDGPIFKD